MEDGLFLRDNIYIKWQQGDEKLNLEEETNYSAQNQSKFNYANSILQRIDYLQFKATESFRKGDLEAWFFEWKSIKFQVAGKLSKEDREYLERIESQITKLLEIKKRSEAGNKAVTKLIEKYLSYIQIKIEEWGMGLVSQKDDTIFT